MSNYPLCDDIWGWIAAFPPVSEWTTNSESINPCRQSQLPLLLTAEKETLKPWNEPPNIILSLRANFEPNRIVLWKSNAFNLVHADDNSAQDNPMASLFSNFIDRILKDGPQKEPQFQISEALAKSIDSKIFNCAFFLMALCVSVYDAPPEIRPRCLEALDKELKPGMNSFKLLLQAVGSNIARLVMRSMGFALIDRMASDNRLNPLSRDRTIPSPLSFFQSHCTKDEWKFQVYAPVFAMEAADEKPIKSPKAVDLLRTLGFLHLEACLLLKYSLNFTPHSIEVQIGLANVICDVLQLLPTANPEERVAKEKHFPSQISVKVTLLEQCNIISTFDSTCTNNKSFQISRETNSTKGLNFQIGRSGPTFGYSVTSGSKEGLSTSFTPWMFEQIPRVNEGKYLYSLSDINTGKKVTESRPSQKNNGLCLDMDSFLSCAFNAEGGIAICTEEGITWKLGPKMEGKTLRWEVEGEIWVTYWPNKYKGSYSENRRLSFSDTLEMDLTR